MTSVLHLAGYAISRRAQLSASKEVLSSKDIIIKCTCDHCTSVRTRAEHKRLNRVKARSFMLVTSKVVQGSKAAVICCEDFSDDHNAIAVFHSLKIAKAYKEYFNNGLNQLSSFWHQYVNAQVIFSM